MPGDLCPSPPTTMGARAAGGSSGGRPAGNQQMANQQQDLSPWMLLAWLVLTVSTIRAAVYPPGGVWANERFGIAPIMSTLFPVRYEIFMYTNSAALVYSSMLVGMLAKHMAYEEPVTRKNKALLILAGLCAVSFLASLLCVRFVNA